MAGPKESTIADLRARDITSITDADFVFVIEKAALYAFDPNGDNVTYSDNGEWLVHSTGNSGLWYPVTAISGSTIPSGFSPYKTEYWRVVTNSSGTFVDSVYYHPGGEVDDWRRTVTQV